MAALKRTVEAGSLVRSAVFLDENVQLASIRVEAAATLTVRLTEVVSLYEA